MTNTSRYGGAVRPKVSSGLWLISVLISAGCTKPNPKSCADGSCTDPSLPYCDQDGSVSGEAGTCVPVTCTANAFVACKGDDELRCNAQGNNYDQRTCDKGCDPSAGCRACEPNQTVCANGEVQTCDASGSIVASETCVLGCFEDQPRCREIDPSNKLGAFMAMAKAGPDLVLTNASLSIPSGNVASSQGGMTLTNTIVPGDTGGASIQVFPVHSLELDGQLTISADGSSGVANSPGVAFVVYGDVVIDGKVVFTGNNAFPGAIASGSCVGAPGNELISNGQWDTGGGGGGGNTAGGSGGSNFLAASSGGAGFENEDLQPLRGGCNGSNGPNFSAASGGGAIQIVSRSTIQLRDNASINANGQPGVAVIIDGQPPSYVTGGGGSGGGILLEAPTVELGHNVLLTANGGGGSSGDGNAAAASNGRSASSGGFCALSTALCTNGGDGGSVFGPATTATSLPSTTQEAHSGAGGGAIGNIRINTATGNFTEANDTFASPLPSTSTIVTK